jgi:hypothetical protein
MASRRSYGTGSLYFRTDTAGRETWYGHCRANGRQINRRIGPTRVDAGRDGLTRTQAEAELRRGREHSAERVLGYRDEYEGGEG